MLTFTNDDVSYSIILDLWQIHEKIREESGGKLSADDIDFLP